VIESGFFQIHVVRKVLSLFFRESSPSLLFFRINVLRFSFCQDVDVYSFLYPLLCTISLSLGPHNSSPPLPRKWWRDVSFFFLFLEGIVPPPFPPTMVGFPDEMCGRVPIPAPRYRQMVLLFPRLFPKAVFFFHCSGMEGRGDSL